MTFFVIGVLGFVLLYIGVPWLHGRLSRILLERKARKQNALVLTFDDGPGFRLTPALLTVLAENNAQATFFPLGRNLEGREEIVKKVADAGHEICSHGYDHLHQWKVSPFRALSDIRRGWKAIDNALGLAEGHTYPYRPPNGKLNLVSLLYLLLMKVPIVYWSADSGDTWPVKPESNGLALMAGRRGGAVCLAHDFDRSNDNTDPFVLNATRAVLAMARERRMCILTISQLLNGGK